MTVRTVDLSSFVSAADIELSSWQRQCLENLPTGTLRLSGYWMNGRAKARRHYDAIFDRYQAMWDCYRSMRTARLSRMRSQYRARRRWSCQR